ncbi:TRAP transporter small permease subunit [Veronia pacifica]|uniref:TRAP transporter small permease protein n=1 Tax=Veronia pacifica TaxID=1080227 RepID=A0A1C3ESC4_9GAMM|nr:TRAP transporter small permease [Veronia pacifica]ODA36141.1 hypothetical protein A8L45_00620 [Veronia pacifica]
MKFEDRVNKLMRLIALGAGYVLLVQAFVTAAEIVSRKVFNHSFQGVDELGGYALAFAASVGFGYAGITCAHTRIDFAIKHAPQSLRSCFHLLASFVLASVSVGMLWFGVRSLRQSLDLGSISTTPLQIPLWIPQSLWVFGLVMFSVVTISIFIRCILKISKMDFIGVESLMRAQSIEQQELDAAGFGDSTSKTGDN